MAAVALVVLPLAHFFVPGERLTLRKSLGFLIGFIGVAVLIGPETFRSIEVDGESCLGDLPACLGRLAMRFSPL
jgi:drug/metabolite transporter (DMT)-like permease